MASVVTTYVVCLKTGFEPVTSEISSPHAAAAPFQTHLYRLFLQLLLLYQYPESNWGLRVMSPTFYRFTILDRLIKAFLLQLTLFVWKLGSNQWPRSKDPRALPLRHFKHTCIGYFLQLLLLYQYPESNWELRSF